jgi:hypothetical protein
MGFVPGIEHDCFISYRHLDDVGPDAVPGHGWVTTFFKAFQTELSKRLGQPSNVFMDPQLDGGAELSPYLRDKARASAILVPIVSPGYQNSPKYCGEEFRNFREESERRGRWSIDNILAVRKIVIEPLDNDLQNVFPVDQPGYWFFEPDPVSKRPRLIDSATDAFGKKVYDLSYDTAHYLKKLQALTTSNGVSSEAAGVGKKELLLAFDVCGLEPGGPVKVVACVAVGEAASLSSRMASFKATLALDPAFGGHSDRIDRLRRAGLRWEIDEPALRDEALKAISALPWDGYVSFADAAFWAQRSEADAILALVHGVLFDRLRGLPDTSVRLVLSPRLAPFWQSVSKTASDARDQIKAMDCVSVVGTSSVQAGEPKEAAVEIANYLGGATAARLANPGDEDAQRRFARLYPNKLRMLRDLRSDVRYSRHRPLPVDFGVRPA